MHRMSLVDVFDASGAWVGQKSVCSCGDHESVVGNAVQRAFDNAAHQQFAAMRGEVVV